MWFEGKKTHRFKSMWPSKFIHLFIYSFIHSIHFRNQTNKQASKENKQAITGRPMGRSTDRRRPTADDRRRPIDDDRPPTIDDRRRSFFSTLTVDSRCMKIALSFLSTLALHKQASTQHSKQAERHAHRKVRRCMWYQHISSGGALFAKARSITHP